MVMHLPERKRSRTPTGDEVMESWRDEFVTRGSRAPLVACEPGRAGGRSSGVRRRLFAASENPVNNE